MRLKKKIFRIGIVLVIFCSICFGCNNKYKTSIWLESGVGILFQKTDAANDKLEVKMEDATDDEEVTDAANDKLEVKIEDATNDEEVTEVADYKLEVKMEDATNDEELIEFYEEDIQKLKDFLPDETITFKSCSIDLNEDGWPDRLVSIISRYHSGQHGDPFRILLNDEGVFKEIHSGSIIRLYYQDINYTYGGHIYILNTQSNGFYDIQIVTDSNSFILSYDGDRYFRSRQIY